MAVVWRKRMRPVQRTNGMNKTESQYAEHLHLLKLANEIIDYRYEPMNLRLASNTYYRPDFLVVYADRFEVHEVKGFWEDDARVKIKVAQETFPWFQFIAVKKTKGGWEFERF